jgi:hypothetical protein
LNVDPRAAWKSGVRLGTLLFDAADATACLTACEADALLDVCSSVLRGDPCVSGDFDCPFTMHCAGHKTCQPGAAIRQPCLVKGDGEEILCVVGNCNTNAGTIVNPVGTTAAPGATCLQNADCGPDAVCARGSDSISRCTSACF